MFDHPAYFLLHQLNQVSDSSKHSINIRAIANLETYTDKGQTIKNATQVTFNENISMGSFKERWYKELFAHLTNLNILQRNPSNIYFGVNPRLSEGRGSNKIEDCAGYNSFYLDCDDNDSFTKEQRLAQIEFWKTYGLPPSILIDSGRGYHVYWLLTKLESLKNQEILKKLVLLSGCKDKGNTHDPTRVLRLPGFYNVKRWYEGERLMCSLVLPEKYQEFTEKQGIQRYEPSTFDWYFPPSLMRDIESYHQRAVALGEGKDLQVRVNELAKVAAQERRKTILQNAGVAISQETLGRNISLGVSEPVIPGVANTAPVQRYKPTRTVVPHIDEIDWKTQKFLKKICLKGWDNYDKAEQEALVEKLERNLSNSEFDIMIMNRLVKDKYTFEAIMEFWQRPGLSLWREGKFKNNPKYLQNTYEKALKYCEEQADSKDPNEKVLSFIPDRIYIKDHNTMIQRGNGQIEHLLSAELILNAKYTDHEALERTEQEWFNFSIKTTTPTGVQTIDRICNGAAFASLGGFKEQLGGDYCRILARSNDMLQKLVLFVDQAYPNVTKKPFYTSLGYKKDKYVFPKYVVTKDGPVMREEEALYDYFVKKYPSYEWFTGDYYSPEQTTEMIKLHWKNLLHCHLPQLIISVLGSIGSSIMRPIFEHHLEITNFNLPTINVRGSSSSGKTETVRHLCRLTGMKPGNAIDSTTSSEVGLIHLARVCGFIPMFIDEFRADDPRQLQKINEIRKIVRCSYSGENIVKGTSDHKMVSFRVHAPLIIAGEMALERIGQVAEVSRIIPIMTDEYVPNTKSSNWEEETSLIKWEKISPYFFQHGLSLNPKTEFENFLLTAKKVKDAIRSTFAGDLPRVAHNLATIVYGCTIIDGCIKKFVPSMPSINDILDNKSIVQHMCTWAIENKHSLILENDDKTTPTQVFSHDEFFTMLNTYAEIQETKDKILGDYQIIPHHEDEVNDHLYIWVKCMHKMVKEYMTRCGKLFPEEEKIRAILAGHKRKQTIWIEAYDKVRKLNNHPARCLVLRLSQVRAMKIWPNAVEKQEPGNTPVDNKVKEAKPINSV